MPKEFLNKELEEVNGGSDNDEQYYHIGYEFTVRGDNGRAHCKVVAYLGDGYYILDITRNGSTTTQTVTEQLITDLVMGFIH